jgi:glycine cleavage system regulatory protein
LDDSKESDSALPKSLNPSEAAGEDQLKSVVVVVTGQNRTGIVADICSKCFTPHHANIGRTRMSTLGTDFGLLAHAVLPHGQIHGLRQSLAEAFPTFVTGVSVQETIDLAKGRDVGSKTKRISMIGPDDMGLLSQLSACVSESKCNILTLTSESTTAPHTGEAVFWCDVILHVPQDVKDAALAERVTKLGEEMGVEITFHDL